MEIIQTWEVRENFFKDVISKELLGLVEQHKRMEYRRTFQEKEPVCAKTRGKRGHGKFNKVEEIQST